MLGFNKGVYEDADQLNLMSSEDRKREKGLNKKGTIEGVLH